MEKYYLKNGKEVQIGDTIYRTTNVKLPYGNAKTTECISVTTSTLPALIKEGIISTKNNSKQSSNYDLALYVERLATKLNWSTDKVYKYLNDIHDVYPVSALSLVLREIALDLDNKYEGHIKDVPEIYVISMFDGKIVKVKNNKISNYNNFAAFRTKEDAELACKILKIPMERMFPTAN
jgi:hypothetical protein